MFQGHFDSIPDAGSGTPYGDHLVGFSSAQGPLLIQFSDALMSVGFNISSKVLLGVDATVKAYAVLNPTSSDIPIFLYQSPPVPCNDAPFVGIASSSAQIRSLLISSTDTAGFYINGLYLGTEQVPEPAAVFLIGGGLLLIGGVSRKYRARS